MMQSRLGTTVRLLAACGITLLAASAAGAQPTPKPSEKNPAPSVTKAPAETQPPEGGDSRVNAGPLISVEFPGGTVAEYTEALRKAAAPDPVNAVVSEQAAKVRLAPIRLRKVALETAVQSIETAAVDAGNWRINRVRMERRDRDPLAGESPVFSVLFEPRNRRSDGSRLTEPGERPMIQVYSLREVTDPKPGDPPGVPLVQKPETVLTAVKIAIELSATEGQAAPEIKYHQDSGLLIVRGTAEQTGLVQQTISTMELDVRQRRNAALQMGLAGSTVADMRASLEKANLMVLKQQAEAKRAADTLARLRAAIGAGTVSAEEVTTAEARAQNAEIEARVAEIEVGRLGERLRSMEEREGTGSPESRGSPSEGGTITRSYNLSAWGDKGAAGGAAVVQTLERASGGVGKEHGATAKYDSKDNTCIVVAEPWGQELARRVLAEYARANRLTFDGAARPGAGAGGPGGDGAGKKK